MAAYTAGKVAVDELLYVAKNYDPYLYVPALYGGALPSEVVEEAGEITREPGDYLTVFASKTLAAGAREVLYTAPEDTTGVIREMVFTNSGLTTSTVRVWLGSVLVEAGLSVPAGASRSQALAGWLLPAGAKLEADSSGAGVNIFAFGVEEVE